MTTFNMNYDKPPICVDCSEEENREFERVIAEQDQRIREHRNNNMIGVLR